MRIIHDPTTKQSGKTITMYPRPEPEKQFNQGEPVPGLDVKMGHNPGGQGIVISTNSTTSIILNTQNLIR